MAVSYFFKIFDPGKNEVQLTDNFVMELKNAFVPDDKNVIFHTSHFRMVTWRDLSRCVRSKCSFSRREHERQSDDH